MSTIRITGIEPGACRIEQPASNASIRVHTPKEYGGDGGGFSASDLLASALGACIATSLAPVAARHGIAPSSLVVDIEKNLGHAPKRVVSLSVSVRVPRELEPDLRLKLERAAAACPVHRSLHPDLKVELSFVVGA